MADKLPLKLAADGLTSQFQSGDTVPVANGGTGGTDAASGRAGLGLGSASTQSTGQSGSAVPLCNAPVKFTGNVQAAGYATPGTGLMVWIGHTGGGGAGYVDAWNGTGGTFEPLNLRGSSVSLTGISTTASAANMFIGGDGSPVLRSTSSLAYKRDVESLEPAYADAILNLRPVWYRSRAGADNPAWGWYGLIAEEVAAIDPRLVHWAYGAEDYDARFKFERRLRKGAEMRPDGVQYERLTVLLLDVVKRERDARLKLEARLAALERTAAG